MLISDEHKFVFVHVPKTGGKSIKAGLAKYDATIAKKIHGNRSSIVRIKPKLADYTFFGFVRNPWDAMVSAFVYTQNWKRRGKQVNHPHYAYLSTFETYLRMILDRGAHPRLDTRLYLNPLDGPNASLVGRFEHLEEDLTAICGKLGLEPDPLPQLHKVPHKHYTKYYNDSTRQLVAERAAFDIERFGYEFGEDG